MSVPNESYYFDLAPGLWTGNLKLEIHDWRRCLRELRGIEYVAALGLWSAGRLGKVTITAKMTPHPVARMAKNDTVLRFGGIWFLPAVQLWHAVGRFVLSDDGQTVDISMYDEYGPIDHLIPVRTKGRAVVNSDGTSATYSLTVFGGAWSGDYRFAPGNQQISAQYKPTAAPWGTISYEASLGSPTPRPPAPTKSQLELAVIAAKLATLGDELRAKHHLLAPFCEVYREETLAIAEALDDFRAPDWAVEMAIHFANRFFSAWKSHDEGRDERTVWKPVFEALETRTMTDLDALAICIYAHIVGDLPRALAATTDASEIADRIDDFQLVNTLLDRTLEEIQLTFVERFGSLYGLLENLVGKRDEVFVVGRVASLRRGAWADAFRLMSTQPATRLEAERELDDRVARFIGDVLDPRPRPLALAAHAVRYVAMFFRRKTPTRGV